MSTTREDEAVQRKGWPTLCQAIFQKRTLLTDCLDCLSNIGLCLVITFYIVGSLWALIAVAIGSEWSGGIGHRGHFIATVSKYGDTSTVPVWCGEMLFHPNQTNRSGLALYEHRAGTTEECWGVPCPETFTAGVSVPPSRRRRSSTRNTTKVVGPVCACATWQCRPVQYGEWRTSVLLSVIYPVISTGCIMCIVFLFEEESSGDQCSWGIFFCNFFLIIPAAITVSVVGLSMSACDAVNADAKVSSSCTLHLTASLSVALCVCMWLPTLISVLGAVCSAGCSWLFALGSTTEAELHSQEDPDGDGEGLSYQQLE